MSWAWNVMKLCETHCANFHPDKHFTSAIEAECKHIKNDYNLSTDVIERTYFGPDEVQVMVEYFRNVSKTPARYILENILSVLLGLTHGIRPMSITCPDGYEMEEWPEEVKLSRASKHKVRTMQRKQAQEHEADQQSDSGESDDSLSEHKQEEYEVEAIVDSRFTNQVAEYLVKWKGYGSHENTWEPATELATKCKAALAAYFQDAATTDQENLRQLRRCRKMAPSEEWPTLRWKHIKLWLSRADKCNKT